MGLFAVGRAVQGPESMVAGLSAGGGFVPRSRSSRRPPSPRPHAPARHRAGGRHCAGRVVDSGGADRSRSLGAGRRQAGPRRHGWARRCAPRKSGRGNAARRRGAGCERWERRKRARRGAVGAIGVRGARPGPAAGAWNAAMGAGVMESAITPPAGAVASAWAKKEPPNGMGGRMVGLRSVASIRCCGSWPGRTDTCWCYLLCKPS